MNIERSTGTPPLFFPRDDGIVVQVKRSTMPVAARS